MVKYSTERLDTIFKALSDSTRRAMLAQLAQGEMGVTELARPHKMSLAAVSKHLKVLESAEFVEKSKEGRNYRCRANLEPLAAVTSVLEELGAFWRGQLDSLEAFISKSNNIKEKKNAGK